MSRRKPHRQTNVERVRALMEAGSPLIQAFVVEAINKYSALCLERRPQAFDSDMLSGAAWIQCAKQAQEWIETNYN